MDIENSEEMKEKFKNFVRLRLKYPFPVVVPDFVKGRVKQGYQLLLEAVYKHDYHRRLAEDLKDMEKELFFKWE